MRFISTLIWIPVLLSLFSCAEPSIDGARWGCQTSADCLGDYVCNVQLGYCDKATDGADGISENTLVVGISAAISTGNATDLGKGMSDGIKACFKEVNANGGVAGRNLELIERDDGYEPDKALDNMVELVGGRRVFAMLGNVGTPTAAVTVPYANEQKALFFGAYTGADLLRKSPPDRYIFNYRASYEQETSQVVDFLINNRDGTKIPLSNIGVLPQGEDSNGNRDGYGDSGFNGVLKALRDVNSSINSSDVHYWTYQRNSSDVTPAVKKFLKWLGDGRVKSADGKIHAAIIMIPTAHPAALFFKELTEAIASINALPADSDTPDLSVEEVDEIRLVDEVVYTSVSFAGANSIKNNLKGYSTSFEWGSGGARNHCEGVIVTQVVPPLSSSSTGVVNYKEALESYDSKLEPGYVSLEGYLAARLFVEALERNGPQLSVETFIDHLEGMGPVDLGIGVDLSFSEKSHQASSRVWATQLDGECNFSELALDR